MILLVTILLSGRLDFSQLVQLCLELALFVQLLGSRGIVTQA